MSFDPKDFHNLYVYVDKSDEKLVQLYKDKAYEHNQKVKKDKFPDAGFDLFCPELFTVNPGVTNKIDLKIKCAMKKSSKKYLSYYMYPRSSISKTPIRLANSVGIIDSGYRGNLCAVVDNISDTNYEIARHNRLFQICSPQLKPLLVEIIDSLNEFEETTRGTGGFGSTGY